ncbi:MAG: hypothetical protein PVH85_29310 [Desulfobacterales bacterium]
MCKYSIPLFKGHSGEACAGLDPVAGIHYIKWFLDTGSVIPDLIRDRYDDARTFTKVSIIRPL